MTARPLRPGRPAAPYFFAVPGGPPDLDPRDTRRVRSGVVLLTYRTLDDWSSGYAESFDVVDLAGDEAVHRDTPGLPSAVVLVDGQVTGRWRRKLRANHVDVDVVAYRRLDDDELAALHAEADRYAVAHGRTATPRRHDPVTSDPQRSPRGVDEGARPPRRGRAWCGRADDRERGDAMRALRAAAEADGLVQLVEVDDPTPAAHEVVVQVEALSVNRGEIMLLRAGREDPPGKDIAGRVVQAAADGSGPPVGTRVVAHPEHSGWAELAPVPTDRVAPLPDEIDAITAAALPLAGTTALGLVRRAGPLYGRRVLLTGASGGVGHYTVELGAAQGARITAVTRSAVRGARLRDLGAEAVVHDVGDAEGPFDVVLESVGGATFDVAYHLLEPDGLMLWFGQASGEPVTIDFTDVTGPWKSTIHRFSHTVGPVPLATDLATLVRMVVDGRLHPELGLVAAWAEAADALRALDRRRVRGNVVLTVGPRRS